METLLKSFGGRVIMSSVVKKLFFPDQCQWREVGNLFGLNVIVAINEESHRRYLEEKNAGLRKSLEQIPANFLEKLLVLAKEILNEGREYGESDN